MTHTINTYYFPKGLRYTTILLILEAANLVYTDHPVWGVMLGFLSAFILTAQYLTIIDIGKKNFVDAFTFYGIKIVSERKNFSELNKIIIKKGKYSAKISTRSSDRQLDWQDYTGTLIYDESGSLDLLTRESKNDLLDAVRIYATALNIPIEDHSIPTSSRSLT